jgi:hypothetical protein
MLAVWLEPAARAAGGRRVSPPSTSTRSTGTPSRSAAVIASTVKAPVPMSWAAISTSAWPSGRSVTRAAVAAMLLG